MVSTPTHVEANFIDIFIVNYSTNICEVLHMLDEVTSVYAQRPGGGLAESPALGHASSPPGLPGTPGWSGLLS